MGNFLKCHHLLDQIFFFRRCSLSRWLSLSTLLINFHSVQSLQHPLLSMTRLNPFIQTGKLNLTSRHISILDLHSRIWSVRKHIASYPYVLWGLSIWRVPNTNWKALSEEQTRRSTIRARSGSTQLRNIPLRMSSPGKPGSSDVKRLSNTTQPV